MPVPEEQRFKDHLARQLRFVERSCEAYDAGNTDEAIRIAVQLRVILHPGGKRRRSLLQHLNASRLPLLTTSEGAPERPDLVHYVGLGSLRSASDGTTATVKYYPGLDNALYRDHVRADRWWNQVVLFLEGTRYSRQDIVLGTAEQDGGAHVAARLTPEYERLIAPGAIGDLVESNDGVRTTKPVTDVHYVCMRQMGYELLNSPELRELADYTPQPQPAAPAPAAPGSSGNEVQSQTRILPLRPDPVRLTREDLERIRGEVIRYFRAYYSELRCEIENHPSEVPEYIRGHRRILFEMGNDGAVITHRRIEGSEDTFEFGVVRGTPVRDLVAAKALTTPNGVTKSIDLEYNLGEDFGENTYLGPLVQQEGDLYYHTDWVQLDYASWVHLDRWSDEDRARTDAKEGFHFRFGNGEGSDG